MEAIPKLTIAHIASEIIIIGSLSYLFNRKITELNTKITELEKKVETSNGGGTNVDAVSSEHFMHFQKETSQHINNLYSIIRQMASSIPDDQRQADRQVERPVDRPQSRVERQVDRQVVVDNRRSNPISDDINRHYRQTHISIASMAIPQPQQTTNSSRVEVVEDDEDVKINDEDLDQELEDELKELECEDDSLTDIKTDVNNTTSLSSINEESPLEFVVPKTVKKTIKKKVK